jgi:hypothetical protein
VCSHSSPATSTAPSLVDHDAEDRDGAAGRVVEERVEGGLVAGFWDIVSGLAVRGAYSIVPGGPVREGLAECRSPVLSRREKRKRVWLFTICDPSTVHATSIWGTIYNLCIGHERRRG